MVKVKICGLTNKEDALFAIAQGANYLGFIFYEKSPRYISPKKAFEIISFLPKNVKTVGVFVNQSFEQIEAVTEQCNLSYIQLHGDELPGFARRLSRPAVKAFRVSDKGSLKNIDEYKNIFAYLFDSSNKNLFGGTGETFNVAVLKKQHFNKPFFLSGGLTPENVGEAIKIAKPFAVDVCSGVEQAPGRKDLKKLSEFIRVVKSVNAEK